MSIPTKVVIIAPFYLMSSIITRMPVAVRIMAREGIMSYNKSDNQTIYYASFVLSARLRTYSALFDTNELKFITSLYLSYISQQQVIKESLFGSIPDQ